MINTKHGLKTVATLLIIAIFLSPALADDQQWNYPSPDADRDVKDISFYEAPERFDILPHVETNRPRNVILMIGDGMAFNHVSLTRTVVLGPDGRLHMERMPVTGIMRTHSANRLVTDSAAAATALASGIKTTNGRIGTAPDGAAWVTILEKARNKGFRTGLVATSAITHATPAGFAAHVEHRNMEAEIAVHMLNNRVGVMFGGGSRFWLPEPHGQSLHNRNLIAEARMAGYQVVHSREQLLALKQGPALGLFADGGMTTYRPEPMIDEMTHVAIRLLSKRDDAWFSPIPKFFMMVEGSQIDWAGHANDADNTIRQTLLFDMAVKEAMDFAQHDKNTLVIVTADHETGGLLVNGNRMRPVADWNSGDHTAGDVPIYAYGPGAIHFTGTHDITDIPRIIAGLLNVENFPAPLKTAAPVAGSAAAQ